MLPHVSPRRPRCCSRTPKAPDRPHPKSQWVGFTTSASLMSSSMIAEVRRVGCRWTADAVAAPAGATGRSVTRPHGVTYGSPYSARPVATSAASRSDALGVSLAHLHGSTGTSSDRGTGPEPCESGASSPDRWRAGRAGVSNMKIGLIRSSRRRHSAPWVRRRDRRAVEVIGQERAVTTTFVGMRGQDCRNVPARLDETEAYGPGRR